MWLKMNRQVPSELGLSRTAALYLRDIMQQPIDKEISAMEHVQKLEEFINSTQIDNLQSMSQADRLQYVLSSKDFMVNMAAGLLMQKDTTKMDGKEPDFDTTLADNGSTDQSSSSIADSNKNFLTSFSKEEKLEIQKKLSMYDQTLKATLAAIKSGKLKDEQILQPLLQNSAADTDMNQLLKNVSGGKIKKLKVDDDISVSIETASDAHPTGKNLSRDNGEDSFETAEAADQYIEQMIKIISHHKKFDNFLDEVSDSSRSGEKLESNPDLESLRHSCNQNESCKLTLEYDTDGNLIQTGTDDILKSKINAQIVRALESLKLDYNLEEDIASAIAKSFENNQNLFPNAESSNSDLAEEYSRKGLSIDSFTSQLEQYKERYLQQLEDLATSAKFESYTPKTNQQPRQHSSEKLHDQNLESQQLDGHLSIQNDDDKRRSGLKGLVDSPKRSKDIKNREKASKLRYYSEPTPGQRQKLQRECMEKLRMQDLQFSEDSSRKSKKKKNKKKKNINGSFTSNGIGLTYTGHSHSDVWLCELCEYKIVYGEIPIFLTEWLQKKANHQEKMENYQRYLLEQRKERKIQQSRSHSECQNHDHQQEYGDGCTHNHSHYRNQHFDGLSHEEGYPTRESLSLPPPPPPPPSGTW